MNRILQDYLDFSNPHAKPQSAQRLEYFFLAFFASLREINLFVKLWQITKITERMINEIENFHYSSYYVFSSFLLF